MRRSLATMFIAVMLACSGPKSQASTEAPQGPAHVGKYGEACRRDRLGPVSYLASDIGKPGVPYPNFVQLALVHQIVRYTHSRTLRFAFIPNDGSVLLPFIIFDNSGADACTGADILNGPKGLTYEPWETPYEVFTPGGGRTPYPWMTPTP